MTWSYPRIPNSLFREWPPLVVVAVAASEGVAAPEWDLLPEAVCLEWVVLAQLLAAVGGIHPPTNSSMYFSFRLPLSP
jgi:hypothetical protein